MRLSKLLLAGCQAALALATPASISSPEFRHLDERGQPLQNIVTWDKSSLSVYGQRLFIYSGEFHPFRLPVPGLWLDVFQKIKALGYNCVSFYSMWGLHEATQGEFQADGIFNYDAFFAAAQQAGIYLLARPGPYINAEVTSGGMPGWLTRNPAIQRYSDDGYLNATNLYMSSIGQILAKAQITNGGPIIMVQVENEYTSAAVDPFPDYTYFAYVEKQLRDAGIVVPLINNESKPVGAITSTTQTSVDIYGFDSYPIGGACNAPYTWAAGKLQTDYAAIHSQLSPSTPFSILEYQGGTFMGWAGEGSDQCALLTGPEFERVFYKNNIAQGIKIVNHYMTYGGTNWGNLPYPGVYTSYDYGAVIMESREVSREKYSESKLQTNFYQASAAYPLAVYQNVSNANATFTGDQSLTVTSSYSDLTKFHNVRHTDYSSTVNTSYTITLPTTAGNISIPCLGGQLSLNGRDSKFHVSDYDLGGVNLLYSTAEIFTWKRYSDRRVLIVYGGDGELHELAVSNGGNVQVLEGTGVTSAVKNGTTYVHFTANSARKTVKLANGLYIYMLNRPAAYNYWVIDLPSDSLYGNFTNPSHLPSALVVQSPYLVRTVVASGTTVAITGDFSASAPIEVFGAPSGLNTLTFNGQSLSFSTSAAGTTIAQLTYSVPTVSVPNLSTINWQKMNGLPEVVAGYDDSQWTPAKLQTTNNTWRPLTAPWNLYGSDYGYHTGSLLFRGYFKANGKEKSISITSQGGWAHSHSVWLNSTYLGSFTGGNRDEHYNGTYSINSTLTTGATYVFTVLMDNMGMNMNTDIGPASSKSPRGIVDYSLVGHNASDITWKLTGNLGGETYVDRVRGPLNEGGTYAERNGFHLPGAPTSKWNSTNPAGDVVAPGIAFYSTTFPLNLPQDYDIPIAVAFSTSKWIGPFRAHLFVNGYQVGKFVPTLGPQYTFPVHEGIWNYQGNNTVAMSLWSQNALGASLSGISLQVGTAYQSGYGAIAPAPQPQYTRRSNAY